MIDRLRILWLKSPNEKQILRLRIDCIIVPLRLVIYHLALQLNVLEVKFIHYSTFAGILMRFVALVNRHEKKNLDGLDVSRLIQRRV